MYIQVDISSWILMVRFHSPLYLQGQAKMGMLVSNMKHSKKYKHLKIRLPKQIYPVPCGNDLYPVPCGNDLYLGIPLLRYAVKSALSPTPPPPHPHPLPPPSPHPNADTDLKFPPKV